MQQSLKWYSSAGRSTLLAILAASTVITILFVSLAIDSGSLWHYSVAAIALYFLADSASKIVKKTFKKEHAPKTANRRKSRKTA